MDPELTKFVQTVKTLTKTTGNGRELMVYLDEQKYFLEGYMSRLDEILVALDINEHPLAILMVLNVDASAHPANVPNDLHFVTVAARINHFVCVIRDDLLQYCSKELSRMVKVLLKNLHAVKKAMVMIPTIRRAIDKLQTKPHQLTHFHYLLCEACLMCGNLKPALKVLDQEIYYLNADDPKPMFEPHYYMNYYYLGGVIYTAMKNYDKATTFFEVVFMTACPVVAPITIEAYKKFVLVTLIHFGSVPKSVKANPTYLKDLYKPTCQEYLDLVPIFQSGNHAELFAMMTNNKTIYKRDKNMGLMKQLVKALNRNNLLRLSHLFSTLTLAELAQQVNLKTAESAVNYLLTMRKTNVLYYKIDEKKGTVTSNFNVDYTFEDPGLLISIIQDIEHKIHISKTLQPIKDSLNGPAPSVPATGEAEKMQTEDGACGVSSERNEKNQRKF